MIPILYNQPLNILLKIFLYFCDYELFILQFVCRKFRNIVEYIIPTDIRKLLHNKYVFYLHVHNLSIDLEILWR